MVVWRCGYSGRRVMGREEMWLQWERWCGNVVTVGEE